LVAFADRVVEELAPERGAPHFWKVVRTAVTRAGAATGGTGLDAALARVPRLASHRAIVVLLSDFRNGGVSGDAAARGSPLVSTARHHDVVAAVLHDVREEELPEAAGPVRLVDPEAAGPGRVIDAGSPRARALYRAAGRVRRRALERRLRGDGADVLWLRTDRDPLPAFLRFFQAHAGRVHGVA
jgi:uncharacterized protein (DUF58 family)